MPKFAIERYLNVKMAYNGAFNGDSDTVIFLSNLTGVPQLWQIGIDPDGRILWPVQLTFSEERVMTAYPSPVAGDKRLIYARDVGGNENAQLFLLNPQTGMETRLTTDDGAMYTFGHWSDDGKRLSFTANSRDKALFDVYVQTLGEEAQLVYENNTSGYLWNAAFAPDGKRLLVQHTMGSFAMRLLEITIESGDARLVSPQADAVRYMDAAYLNDETALVITDKDSDFLYIARLDLAHQVLEPLVSPDWDIMEFALSEDKRSLAYSVNADGISKIYRRDMESGATQQLDLGPVPGVVTMPHFAPDGSCLIFTADRATRTSDVYVWHLEGQKLQPVTLSSHAGLPPESFVAPQLIRYPTFDMDDEGNPRQIPAWLYVPHESNGEPLPVVFVVHGGPEGQAMPIFSGLIQSLLDNGYVAFVPNVRGSTGYGKAYSHLDDVHLRMDSVKDLAYGVEWVRHQPYLDAKRIAIYGRSYGGFMVLSALTTYPDLWVAGVEFVGISNFVTFLENTSAYRRSHRESEYGSLAHDRDFLESISPIKHIDNIRVPLFVQHGANDPRVPLSETEQLVASLRQRKVPVELLVFDDEGHGITKIKNQVAAFAGMIAFLNQYTL